MMYTREINGNLYALVKIPDSSTGITFAPDEDFRYVWLRNDAGIRKRIEISLDLWSVVSVMSLLPAKISTAIGFVELNELLIESGLKAKHALLFVKDELKGLADKCPWET